jgi:hypothetical protein
MFKLIKPVFPYIESNFVFRVEDNASIPFDPANTDYAEFKKLVAEGAELQDADGNVMSAEAAQAFVATLP